ALHGDRDALPGNKKLVSAKYVGTLQSRSRTPTSKVVAYPALSCLTSGFSNARREHVFRPVKDRPSLLHQQLLEVRRDAHRIGGAIVHLWWMDPDVLQPRECYAGCSGHLRERGRRQGTGQSKDKEST